MRSSRRRCAHPPHNVALADPVDPDCARRPGRSDRRRRRATHQGSSRAGPTPSGSPIDGRRAPASGGEPRWRRACSNSAQLRQPRPAPGSARRATPADLDLVRTWFDAFADEALPPELAERARQLRRIDTQLDDTQDSAGIWLWETDGRPTSLTGFTTIPRGARIGPVYTPESRARSRIRLERGGPRQRMASGTRRRCVLPLHRSGQPDLEQGLHRPRVRAGVRVGQHHVHPRVSTAVTPAVPCVGSTRTPSRRA